MSQIKHPLAPLAVAGVVILAGLGGVAAWTAQDGRADEPDESSLAQRGFFHEREFASRPMLAALPHQVVILDLEPASSAEALRENVARWQLPGGRHTFCMDKDDPHLIHLSLEDESGTPLVKVERGNECVQATLTSGVYQMRIWHDASKVGESGRVAFVQSPSQTVPLHGGDGRPVGGYWALRPDPLLDPQRRPGRMRVLPPFQYYSDYYPSIEPMVVDFSSQSFDDTALFVFKAVAQPRVLGENLSLDLTDLLLSTEWYLIAKVDPCDGDCSALGHPGSLTLNDLGNSKVSWTVDKGLPFYQHFYLASDNWIRLFPPGLDQVTAQLLFRFFPAGTPIDPPLREGEVALFQECNYQGKATVFSLNTPDFSALTSPAITLDKSTASVKLGNNTAVNLYPEANFQGATQLITADTPCLDSTSIGRGTRAIQVQPLSPLLVASSDCENCKLEGVDLSGRNLSGIDLQGADLSGAHLTQTIFHNAKSLVKTNFTGATLACTDFSGTEMNPVDLTESTFINAKFTEDFSCRADFAYTKLTPEVLPPSLWRYFDLSHAAIEGLANYPLSTPGQPLDLSQADLTGVSLAGVDLTAALLNNATLVGVNLSTAKLYGANLDGANLEGANLSGAFLTNNPQAGITGAASFAGARLKNVNLSNAHLSGANLINANFYGTAALGEKTCEIDSQGFTKECASASGATMNNTQFSGAYLYGVDFTNSTIQGVQFGNAVLVGANFAGAKLSTDPSVGTESGFNAAFLQGANLAAAAELNGISLQNAFVDFRSEGNDMYLLLNGDHTAFARWETPGQKVCVFIFYTGPTTVPTTNTTLICPDGSAAGSGGCGHTEAINKRWMSRVEIDQTDPPASYLEDATYTKKAETPICSPPSGEW